MVNVRKVTGDEGEDKEMRNVKVRLSIQYVVARYPVVGFYDLVVSVEKRSLCLVKK